MTDNKTIGWSSRGLYVHVPFCFNKCRYCDFVSCPFDEREINLYCQALCREINLYGSFNEYPFSTLYIGGGTPSCLSVGQLQTIIEKIGKTFTFVPDPEITIEANPGTLDREKLFALANVGVNRISLGVQSFNEGILRLLGRIHTVQEAIGAVKDARAAGFKNISIDLIYGLPKLTLQQWRETLKLAVELNVDHISAYGLQLEAGTPLYEDVLAGKLGSCPEDLELEMYFETIKTLEGEGYRHYEISNFARPSMEARHNLIYWYNGSYLGLGPAAHSSWEGYRWSNAIDLQSYRGEIAKGRRPVAGREAVDRKAAMGETMFLGLRKIEGVSECGFTERFGVSIDSTYGNTIDRYAKLGLLERENGFIRLTDKGLLLSNEIFVNFV